MLIIRIVITRPLHLRPPKSEYSPKKIFHVLLILHICSQRFICTISYNTFRLHLSQHDVNDNFRMLVADFLH